jgi:hypothetical protein
LRPAELAAGKAAEASRAAEAGSAVEVGVTDVGAIERGGGSPKVYSNAAAYSSTKKIVDQEFLKAGSPKKAPRSARS